MNSNLLEKIQQFMDHIFVGFKNGGVEFENKTQSLEQILQYLKILSFIVDGIRNDKYYSKREIFYKSASLFDHQEQVNLIIKKLSYQLQVPRRQFHIISASKGLVCGAIKLHGPTTIDLYGLASQGKGFNITELMDEWSPEIYGALILVVEKETIYFRLLNEKNEVFLKNTVLITGKGYPCHATKSFLRFISEMNPNVPVFYLGDMDPHGFDILCQYAFGNELSKWEQNDVPWIQWFNVWIDQIGKVELSNKEKIILSTVLERPELPLEWRSRMQIKTKFEVEDIQCHKLSDYIMDKLKENE